jgi:sRNA-binding carbon storage regulator CsrA
MALTLARRAKEKIVLREGGPTGKIIGTICVQEILQREVKLSMDLPRDINIARLEVDAATVPYQRPA